MAFPSAKLAPRLAAWALLGALIAGCGGAKPSSTSQQGAGGDAPNYGGSFNIAGGTATQGANAGTANAGTAGSTSAGSGNTAGGASGNGGAGGTMNAGSGGAAGNANFVHPGILHTQIDLDRMQARVATGTEPYLSGYNVFRAHAQSSPTYAVRGGFAELGRNPDVHKNEGELDANAAYQNALMWSITGTRAHADKAIQILDAWSSTLTTISGADAILAAGIDGFKFVSAAEIIRYTNAGWPAANVTRAENMFKKVFYPVIQDFATFSNGNWSLSCVMTIMAIGVFTNDHAMFDRAVTWYQSGPDNGALMHYVINDAGQCQESGRDQSHTQLGLAFAAQASEIAWHQGIDLYGTLNGRLLKGFEYTASYNLGNDVPFVETTDTTGKYHQTVISADRRGMFRPIYEMVLNHYQSRKGLACPFTTQVAQQLRPEGAAFQADHPGFGTLLFTGSP